MVWSPTFGDRAEVLSWLASTVKGQKAVTEAQLRYVLTPEFGARAASEIDEREWQTWVDSLSRQGLSRSRLANHLAAPGDLWPGEPRDAPSRRSQPAGRD